MVSTRLGDWTGCSFANVVCCCVGLLCYIAHSIAVACVRALCAVCVSLSRKCGVEVCDPEKRSRFNVFVVNLC